MRKLSVIFILISFLSQAQINRFVYEYKYIPNINEKDTVRNEMMVLEIDAKGSKYYSYERFVQDSLTKIEMEKQIAAGGNNFNFTIRERGGNINYKVIKNYPDFNVFLVDRIGQDLYKIAEDEIFTWKILPDTQKIGEYKAQKAAASFGGREWVAWFSPELPFQDGPYKFHGLPGLIVKVEDVTGSHIMTLVANRKIKEAADTEVNLPGKSVSFGFGGKEIEVSEKQFKKVWQDYLSDPAKNMRQMMMNNSPEHKVIIKMKTEDGREIPDMNEIYKNMEKRVKESAAKNNNRIEPTLYAK